MQWGIHGGTHAQASKSRLASNLLLPSADAARMLILPSPSSLLFPLHLLTHPRWTPPAPLQIFLLFTECYPTKLRSAAIGSGMMFGKVGAAAASPLVAAFPLLVSLGISGGLLLSAAGGAALLPVPEKESRGGAE